MSAPIETKQKLLRLAWFAALRREGHRQCTGKLIEGDLVCAIGLLAEVAGLSTTEVEAMEEEQDYPSRTEDALGELAGLDDYQVCDITSMNDGKQQQRKSFAEIADVVESWYDKNGDRLPPKRALPNLPPGQSPDQQELLRNAWLAALRREWHRHDFDDAYDDVLGALVGLTPDEIWRVVELNNLPKAPMFCEIADAVEAWFAEENGDRQGRRRTPCGRQVGAGLMTKPCAVALYYFPLTAAPGDGPMVGSFARSASASNSSIGGGRFA